MIFDLLEARKEVLVHYSPYSFLAKGNFENIYQHSIVNTIKENLEDKNVEFIEITISGYEHIFVVKFLAWDSEYFNMKTYKILNILYKHKNFEILNKAIQKFIELFFTQKGIYCFFEIPSEDIFTIQSLNTNRFKLVENRLTYYLPLNNYNYERFNIREATIEDIPNLKRVARLMRNDYDRFHAETIFDLAKADEFLATYIEESVKGFADFTMVPSGDVPPDAFLTANYLKNEWDSLELKISKMVLSAVASDTCKGWYLKLISEMAYHLKEQKADYAFMHPATTNRAVINTYEKLGCKYGKCVHVLTYFS